MRAMRATAGRLSYMPGAGGRLQHCRTPHLRCLPQHRPTMPRPRLVLAGGSLMSQTRQAPNNSGQRHLRHAADIPAGTQRRSSWLRSIQPSAINSMSNCDLFDTWYPAST